MDLVVLSGTVQLKVLLKENRSVKTSFEKERGRHHAATFNKAPKM